MFEKYKAQGGKLSRKAFERQWPVFEVEARKWPPTAKFDRMTREEPFGAFDAMLSGVLRK